MIINSVIKQVASDTDAYVRPSDWIDIDTVSTNNIKLLVCDLDHRRVQFTVTCTGGYTVTWGDSTSNSYSSNANADHTYTLGAGTSCSRGYTTFAITISPTTGNNITSFKFVKTSFTGNHNMHYVLDAVLNTPSLTTLHMCGFTSDVSYTALGMLERVKFVNTTMSSFVGANGVFWKCSALKQLVLPATMPASTTLSVPHAVNLKQPNTNNCTIAIQGAPVVDWTPYDLLGSTLIQSYSNGTTYKKIKNSGSVITLTTFDYSSMRGSPCMCETIDFTNVKCGQILNASAIELTGLRSMVVCSDATGNFGGSSPQITVANSGLDGQALNALFTSLPTVTSKTIVITGAVGAYTCNTALATAKGWTVTN